MEGIPQGNNRDWRSPEMVAADKNNEAVIIRYKVNSIIEEAQSSPKEYKFCAVFSYKEDPYQRFFYFMKDPESRESKEMFDHVTREKGLTCISTSKLDSIELRTELGNAIAHNGPDHTYKIDSYNNGIII